MIKFLKWLFKGPPKSGGRLYKTGVSPAAPPNGFKPSIGKSAVVKICKEDFDCILQHRNDPPNPSEAIIQATERYNLRLKNDKT